VVHDPALEGEPELLESAAAAARMAIDNERLQAEVRSQLREVRASRARIVEAGDRERRRVERNLHDGAQQRLVTLSMALGMIRDRAAAAAPVGGGLAGGLDEAIGELRGAIGDLRRLARGIHPAILTDEGLGAALESLAARSPVPVAVCCQAGSCAAAAEVTAYFVVAEGLANVAKHAYATGATVTVTQHGAGIRVEVADDGAGGPARTPGRACAGWPTGPPRAAAPSASTARRGGAPASSRSCPAMRADPPGLTGPARAARPIGSAPDRTRAVLAEDSALFREGLT